jgi:hypothetical protein
MARKRRATKGRKYRHDYSNEGRSRTWANAAPEVRSQVKRIDSVVGQADKSITPDYTQSVAVEKATGLTCAICHDWKEVYWVRAWSLAARVRPGVPVKCSDDLCVVECLTCGNWTDFWRTASVERKHSLKWRWTMDESCDKPLAIASDVISYTGTLVAPGVKRI